MYLVKIYIVVIEWRGHNSNVHNAADVVIDEENLANDLKNLSTNITMYNFKK